MPARTNRATTAWSVDEVGRFLAVSTEDRLAAMWVTYVRSGARRGELLSLTWTEDVDLEASTLAVRRSRIAVQTDHGRRVYGKAKAKVRRVRLHDRRHGMATRAAGVPIEVVSDRLGHARSSVTYDMHTHPDDAQQPEAADAFIRLIAGEAETS